MSSDGFLSAVPTSPNSVDTHRLPSWKPVCGSRPLSSQELPRMSRGGVGPAGDGAGDSAGEASGDAPAEAAGEAAGDALGAGSGRQPRAHDPSPVAAAAPDCAGVGCAGADCAGAGCAGADCAGADCASSGGAWPSPQMLWTPCRSTSSAAQPQPLRPGRQLLGRLPGAPRGLVVVARPDRRPRSGAGHRPPPRRSRGRGGGGDGARQEASSCKDREDGSPDGEAAPGRHDPPAASG